MDSCYTGDPIAGAKYTLKYQHVTLRDHNRSIT